MAPRTQKRAVKAKSRKITKKFTINATGPTNDKIFDPAAFKRFLEGKIKVENRVGNLGDKVVIEDQKNGKVEVTAHIERLSGRYIKYLTKKFLKSCQLRDWLRVVATSKGVYELKFFNVVNDEADDDDDE